MSPKLQEFIEKAKKRLGHRMDGIPEDYDVDGYAGGNIDDAFQNGLEFGEASMLSDIIALLEEESK